MPVSIEKRDGVHLVANPGDGHRRAGLLRQRWSLRRQRSENHLPEFRNGGRTAIARFEYDGGGRPDAENLDDGIGISGGATNIVVSGCVLERNGFRTKGKGHPLEFCSNDLPADFAQIPPDHTCGRAASYLMRRI